MRSKTAAVMASIATAGILAGCGTAASTSKPSPVTSSPSTILTPPLFTDPIGGTCLPSVQVNGYCPGDAPSTTAPPVNAAQADLAAWCAGPGYSDFQSVQSDLSQLQTDSGNSDLAAVEQDGSQLFNDAHTAALNLPPKSDKASFGYGLWLGYLLIAGYRASSGNLSGPGSASTALQSASTYRPDALAVNASCGGSSS